MKHRRVATSVLLWKTRPTKILIYPNKHSEDQKKEDLGEQRTTETNK